MRFSLHNTPRKTHVAARSHDLSLSLYFPHRTVMAGILQRVIRSGCLDTRRNIRVQALPRALSSFNGASGDDQDEELHPQWRCVFVNNSFHNARRGRPCFPPVRWNTGMELGTRSKRLLCVRVLCSSD